MNNFIKQNKTADIYDKYISNNSNNKYEVNKLLNNSKKKAYQLKNQDLKPKTLTNPTLFFNLFNSKTVLDASLNVPMFSSTDSDSSISECNIIKTDNKYVYPYKLTSINNIGKFILIIDFPNIGGGANFFINTIVSKYKKFTTFLIARNVDNNIIFNINEDYEIDKKYNNEESIYFLQSIKNKIKKIFINHTIGHTDNFVKFLFSLNKNVTAITHDYSMLLEKYNPSYKEITEEGDNLKLSKFNISLCNRIVTQDINNYKIFKSFFNKDKIVIATLPDFKKSSNIVYNTNDNNTIIGIIGLISDIKGEIIIKDILSYYKQKDNVKIFIFGKTNITDFDNKKMNSQIYNSIDELNKLLIYYKPHVLIEASLWPETYSYTLTLAMITQLPILYLKKPFESVVENRLANYEKSYIFNSMYQLNELLFAVKQNFFYTIEPVIYYNKFWDNYFLNDDDDDDDSNKDNINKDNSNISVLNDIQINKHSSQFLFELNINNKNLILITSKIYVSNNSFSYSKIRSIYTPEERFLQTLNTINSVKKNIPDAYIILFDNSNFKNNFYFNKIKESVDTFLNITDNQFLNYCTDICQYKAFAEISQLLEIYKILFKKVNFKNIKNLFKITGRYVVNNDFCYAKYDNKNNIIKQNEKIKDRTYWYTCFYKINKHFIHQYFEKLHFILENKDKYSNIDLEVIFSKIFKYDFELIDNDNLGITQNIAVWNEINNI
jgi:hypothetical protein